MDFDFTPWGIEENLVVIVGWMDFGAGGEFGYSPDGQTFFPESDPERVNCYRPNPEFVGVLRIAPILDDIPIGISSGELTYDDPVTVGDPWTMTIWEFWITPCPKNWRPKLDEDLSFAAWIEPTTDHKGNPMVGTIIFLLSSSNQPGHCLNDCRLGSTGQWAWDGTTGCHDDFQFLPEQLGFTVLPRNQTPEGIGYNYDTAMSSLVTNVATVTVRCLDYGGWTYLMGYVIGFFGEGAARRIDAPDLFVVDIPVDKNENHIADYWEDLRDPPSRDPLSDDDDTPVGDGRTDGDGLSLYEEYRGLMKQGRWRDFDPWIKDMFVTNFGAVPRDPENGDWSFVIPNEAITSPDGFIGAGMPPLWLLNANEGSGYPLRVVNFLWGYAHRRDVYAAIVVPSWGEVWVYADRDGDGQPEDNDEDGDFDKIVYWGFTYGPIWGQARRPYEGFIPPPDPNWGNQPLWGPPVCEIDMNNPNSIGAGLIFVVGHELGHTVLWDKPAYGHHFAPSAQDCFMFQPTIVFWPTEFCGANPGCQSLWKLNP
jgi:hypothetical protein